MRLLEKPTWEKYVPAGIPDGMMVYHWKKVRAGEPEKDWEVTAINELTTFVRLDTRHSSFVLRLVFLAIALSIGVLGSLAAGWIPIQREKVHTSTCVMKQTDISAHASFSNGGLVLSGQCRGDQ